jgi:serine/threonine-protein kinase RsbW/sigma-B regulation protein RsbU (phosphoserine phosphatase)
MVFRFLHDFIQQNSINDDDAYAIQLVTEELFTNLVKYNKEIDDDILMKIEKQESTVEITFVDPAAQPFDLKNTDTYDTKQVLEDRPIGKVGIHLIRKYIDEIAYDHKNKKSTIRLIKHLRQ